MATGRDGSRRRTRGALTREKVLDAAVTLADREGIEAVSMRALARELGYEVMSLYNHVENKDDVLDGIVERTCAEIEIPSSAVNWKSGVRVMVLSAHEMMTRHRWAVRLWSTQRTGPARLAIEEGLLRTLRQGGLPPAVAYHGYHALLIHILGFSLTQQSIPADMTDMTAAAASAASRLSPEQFPYLHEHLLQHADDPGDQDFAVVLDLILDGLDRERRRHRR